MGLTAITHPTGQYNDDYIYEMAMKGREPEFWVNRRGLGNLSQRYRKQKHKYSKAQEEFRQRAMKTP